MAAKTATKKTPAAKTVAKPANGNRKFGTKRTQMAKRSVTLRDKNHLSWVQIADKLGCTPRMANRLYDEVKGKGAHYGLLEGKGGRTKAA